MLKTILKILCKFSSILLKLKEYDNDLEKIDDNKTNISTNLEKNRG